MNHRLSWLGVVQTLLFTAYGFSIQLSLGIGLVIAFGGVVTAFLILLGTGAAVAAQIFIAQDLGENKLGVHPVTTVLGWAPPIGIPLACLFAWLYLSMFWVPPEVEKCSDIKPPEVVEPE